MADRARPTEIFREDHRHLTWALSRLRERVEAGSLGEVDEGAIQEGTGFLAHRLIPQLEWEAEVLMPRASAVLERNGRSVPMPPDGGLDALGLARELAAGLEAGERMAGQAERERLRMLAAELEAAAGEHFRRVDSCLDEMDQLAERKDLEDLIFSAKQAQIH